MNAIDLKGRNAIVTGGAQGIGRAIAARLLGSGAAVALWDRDAALLAETARELDSCGEVSTAVVDVTDAAAVTVAFASTVERHGAVDVMVNNAGIAGSTMPSWEYPLDEWRAVIDVDLNGVYYCCRAALPHMRERDYGRIVNIASIAGKEGNPNAAAYSAAKAGVIALTKSLAKETADRNIAVNCVTPRRGEDPNLRSDLTGPHRLHALEDPARTVPCPRRGSGHGRLDGLRGEFVHDRGGVRPERRPGDVLTASRSGVVELQSCNGVEVHPMAEPFPAPWRRLRCPHSYWRMMREGPGHRR